MFHNDIQIHIITVLLKVFFYIHQSGKQFNLGGFLCFNILFCWDILFIMQHLFKNMIILILSFQYYSFFTYFLLQNVCQLPCVIFQFFYHQKYFQAEYVFDVFPVQKCPMCKEDWEMASRRLNCNSSYGYHCVPNKQFTSLIEFCYPKGPRFPFEKGTAFLLDITLIYYLYMFRKNNTLHCFITKKTFVCFNKIFFF